MMGIERIREIMLSGPFGPQRRKTFLEDLTESYIRRAGIGDVLPPPAKMPSDVETWPVGDEKASATDEIGRKLFPDYDLFQRAAREGKGVGELLGVYEAMKEATEPAEETSEYFPPLLWWEGEIPLWAHTKRRR